MALETLMGLDKIGGFAVVRGCCGDESPSATHPVLIDDANNSITFKIQNGPIKEAGVNGCQVDTLIATARTIIGQLDAKYPSEWNKAALAGLDGAIRALAERTKDRERRGVEGRSAK